MPAVLIKSRERTSKMTCSLCKFCIYKDKYNSEICCNEKSENYGKLLSSEDMAKQTCENITDRNYKNISLKDALLINTQPKNLLDISYHHALPNEDYKHPFVILTFEDNESLENWRDARTRLFMEHINTAQERISK